MKTSYLVFPVIFLSLVGCQNGTMQTSHGQDINEAIFSGPAASGVSPDATPAPGPQLGFINSPANMIVGQCNNLTVQLQDAKGNPIPAKDITTDVKFTIAFNTNNISGTHGAPVAFSDATCSTKNWVNPKSNAKVNMAGYSPIGIFTIPANSNSVQLSIIPITSISFLSPFIAMDQGTTYANGFLNISTFPGAPAQYMVAGPDTLGQNVCSPHPFYARVVDSINDPTPGSTKPPVHNPANLDVGATVTLQLSGLGSAVAYSDPGCTKSLANNQITLQHSCTTLNASGQFNCPPVWGSSGVPDSDVAFYLKDSKSESLSLIASVASQQPANKYNLSFLYGVDLWTTALANPGSSPIPPQTTVSIQSRPTLGACGSKGIKCVPAGSSLESAISSASPGDIIVLDAGATYPGSLTLPPGSSNITITTSNLSKLPPQGTRVSPSDVPNMATIEASNIDYAINVTTGVSSGGTQSSPPSSHWRFIGVEVTIPKTSMLQYTLLDLGIGPNANPNQLADLASYITVESSYVHGNASADLQHCIGLDGVNEAVVDSYISDCHFVGADAQAIGAGSGQTLLISNNYLEGSGENIMFGGALAPYPNAITTDVQILNNTFNKPLNWFVGPGGTATAPTNPQFVPIPGRPGQRWTVKNMLEFKEGRRIQIEGNTFTNEWQDAQQGVPLVMTPMSDGIDYFVVTEDLNYTNNIVAHSLQLMGFAPICPIAPAH